MFPMSTTRQLLYLFATAAFFVAVLIAYSATNERTLPGLGVISASAHDFTDYVNEDNERLLIDIRTPEEYDAGHLPDAKNIDFYEPDFLQQLADLDRNQPIAIYCRSGNRSSETLAAMKQMGFTDVAELSGGILAWQEFHQTDVCPGGRC